jgi:hypothetical protein
MTDSEKIQWLVNREQIKETIYRYPVGIADLAGDSCLRPHLLQAPAVDGFDAEAPITDYAKRRDLIALQ